MGITFHFGLNAGRINIMTLRGGKLNNKIKIIDYGKSINWRKQQNKVNNGR